MTCVEGAFAWDRLEPLALADIDTEDRFFRVTTRNETEGLEDTVRRIGLLEPPLLWRREGRMLIVSGFRRVSACRRLGWKSLPARILDPQRPAYACALRAVAENSLARPLNLIETSRALALLEATATASDEPLADAALLGLPGSPAAADRLRGLCRLPDDLQQGLLDGTIPLAMALELRRHDPDDAAAFARLFRRLKISLNKQREMVALVREIAARENRRLQEVLAEPGFAGPLDSPKLDGNQKASRMRAWLKRRRFPEIAGAEENFRRQVKRLPMGEGMRLSPPRDFEGALYELALTFGTVEELSAQMKKLAETAKHPALKAILEGKPLCFEDAPPAGGGGKTGTGGD